MDPELLRQINKKLVILNDRQKVEILGNNKLVSACRGDPINYGTSVQLKHQ